MTSTSTKRRRSRDSAYRVDEAEPWLVSYADLVTLLLGFFIILYSMSSLDEKKFSVVTNAVSGALGNDQARISERMKKDTQELPKEEYERMMYLLSKLNLGSLAELAAAAENTQKTEQAKTRLSELIGTSSDKPDELFEVILPNITLFQSSTATLTVASRKDLLGVAEKIKATKGLTRVVITGHTDSQASSRSAATQYGDNWGLSAARAAAVGSVLQSYGVPATMLEVTGKGSSEPLFPEVDAKGHRLPVNMERNRRVHIVLKLK